MKLFFLLLIPVMQSAIAQKNYSELLPRVSPDGKKIAFLSTWTEGKTYLFVADADGSNAVRIFKEDTCKAGEFCWSPDSKKIAFGRRMNGVFQIAIGDVNGLKLEVITNTGQTNNSPAWSEDGKLIAFESRRNNNLDVYTYNLHTKEEKRITTDTANDSAPCWSLNGEEIVFQSSKKGGVVDVCIMDKNGGNIQNLTNSSMGTNSDPTFSPDGKKIVFMSTRDKNMEIYLMSKDGSSIQNISNHEKFDYGFGWFPDNENLLFDSNRDGFFRLYKLNTKTQEVEKLNIQYQDENMK